MKLSLQKRLASEVLGIGENRVFLDPEKADEIKEAITRADIRALIAVGAIKKKPVVGTSRGRARKIQNQKKKGRRKGTSHRKGAKNARLGKKKKWMSKVRSQRNFIRYLKEKNKLSQTDYRKVYRMVKGGFFRSVSHIKVFMKRQTK